jgi:hypothetical protein
MLRTLINNAFLNDMCGRILGGRSKLLKSVVIFLLIGTGLLFAGTWKLLKIANPKNYTFSKSLQLPRFKTT